MSTVLEESRMRTKRFKRYGPKSPTIKSYRIKKQKQKELDVKQSMEEEKQNAM